MELARRIAAVSVMLLLLMTFMPTSGTARPLGGDDVWTPAREAVSSDVVVRLLRQIYLQKLGARASCGTNSSNGGCPRHNL
ncbi:hypothetical protein PR202_ga17567 [Eleusine coracana subsp. coracana]|uniref:Uncharacterized protein n=1 Tax=Eleusine coracana subsp. coracana TaxID=191504 RepID=A0AAV5CPG1_ELECO|nr:hypothetical protein PR202_ga17320 [Eleusine coracana subsp. coracana]GJN00388.1 hypothetical protein PR202_ga17567 [Eleusine coracana subsp. coracana]